MDCRENEARPCAKVERHLFFIAPDDKESKETMNNAEKMLELPMESVMPCDVQNRQCRESFGKGSDTRRSTCACIVVEAHESTRKRLDRTLQKDHEDHIARKGFNSLTHLKIVHKFNPIASSDENSSCQIRGGKSSKNCQLGK